MSRVVMVVACRACGAWQDASFATADFDNGFVWRCDICDHVTGGPDCRAFALAAEDARLYDLWLRGFSTVAGSRRDPYRYVRVDVRPVLEPML